MWVCVHVSTCYSLIHTHTHTIFLFLSLIILMRHLNVAYLVLCATQVYLHKLNKSEQTRAHSVSVSYMWTHFKYCIHTINCSMRRWIHNDNTKHQIRKLYKIISHSLVYHWHYSCHLIDTNSSHISSSFCYSANSNSHVCVCVWPFYMR